MKYRYLLLLAVFTFCGCEKDDICAEETTPRLIIDFYDFSNPTVPKNVTGLEVIGEGQSAPLNIFSGTSRIELPLKISEDITQYRLKIFSSSTVNANEDVLQFNYSRQNVYVSRSCGYKTIFSLNDSDGAVRTDSNTPDGLWMKAVTVNNKNITTENETHLKIYF